MPSIYNLEVTPSGIYFQMPNDEYHNDKSLSNSNMGRFEKTAEHVWVQSPLNPNKRIKDSTAYKTGRAMHELLLEPEKFHKNWIIKPDGKTSTKAGTLTAEQYRDLKVSIEKIKSDPHFKQIFMYGYPEVSIFWRDERTGVPCRIRPDWLGLMLLADLKSVADIELAAIYRSIIKYGYARQAAFYIEGVKQIKELIISGRAIVKDCPNELWLQKFLEFSHDRFIYVFQEKEEPNVTFSAELCEQSLDMGRASYEHALDLYKRNYEEYGEKRWPSGYEGRTNIINWDDLPPSKNYKMF